MTKAEEFTKLPEIARPQFYDIYLKPCLKTFKSYGTSTILLSVLKNTKFLTLHANELDIKSVSAVLANGKELNNLRIQIDNKWSYLTLNFLEELEPQDLKLNFEFVGELNNKMQGFSRSSFKDIDGNEQIMVSTQFESTYARTAFPCWDEPIYKAIFNVTLEVDKKFTALSNMNVVDEKPGLNGTKVLKFAETPIMSTYLLAFAIGDFEYIETKTDSGIIVRVYTTPGKKEQGHYALNFAAKCLDWYSKWFDIPCKLTKCDLIAIPDFQMGAMENWGLVTFREIGLLFDPTKTSTLVKTRMAMVISHELAHFWFGNLATMKWWCDLWLKEGFASFMEFIFIGHNYPEFKIWNHFVTSEIVNGFNLDSLRSSHPIEMEINNPNELDEIYDAVTYCKSNSLIRMLCNYLSEEVFQKGLQIYLKRFSYSNAVTVDLWNAFSEASGMDIKNMMSSWTQQMGYPLITVLEQKIEGNKRILKLKQNRFIADGGEDPLNTIWQIPIQVITASSSNIQKFLMSEKEQEFVVENVYEVDWIKLNASASGFYHVKYTAKMLNDLLPAIQSKKLLCLDRFGIANDYFALFKSGQLNVSDFLEFFKGFSNENEYIVLGALDQCLSTIENIINHSEDLLLKNAFNKFVISVLEPVLNNLGQEPKENEDLQTGIFRELIKERLSKCNSQKIIDIALEKFYQYIENGVELTPDLRKHYFGVAARQNQKENIQKLKKLFKTVGFSEVERDCIVALAQVSDPEILKEVYYYLINQNNMRLQDTMTLFAFSQGSKNGQIFTWAYFKDNYDLLLKNFGSANSTIFQRCLKLSAQSSCDEEVAKDFEEFLKKSLDSDALKVLQRPMAQIIESIRNNAKLFKQNIDELRKYFKV